MKHLIKNSRILTTVLCLLILSFAVHAQGVEKQKEFTKTYSLHNGQGVSVTNKFGKVEVRNWNQDEVKVAVAIIARAGNDASAQHILDAIMIESKDGNTVTFTTRIESKNDNNSSDRRAKSDSKPIEINYVVYLPENNKIDIDNSFGNTFVPDRKGVTNLKQSFGDLTVDELNNATITAAHSYVNIKALSGGINGEFDFCKRIEIGFTNELKKADLNFLYAKNIAITLPPTIDATFDIETRYGKVNNKTAFKIVQTTPDEKPGPTIKRTYSGQAGTGKASVKIHSNFGDILLK